MKAPSESSPRPLRILFTIARGDSFGGSSLHILDMATRLTKEGHEVNVVVGGDPTGEVPERYSAAGLSFHCVESMGRNIHPLQDFRSILQLRKIYSEFQPDIISLHSSKAGTLGRLAAIGLSIPVLYTPHCWAFVEGFRHATLFRRVEQILSPLSTRIITVSEDERQFGLRSGVGRPNQIVTIHNGVRDQFPGGLPDRETREATRMVMVARFEEQKNQKLLIQALHRLDHLSWTLTLIGDGPFRKECEELAGSLGLSDRIHFEGYRSDIPDLLTKHDLFLLVTRWEGFPRSTLEAMGAGLPVLVSDVGGSREMIQQGETGFLVEPENQNALVDTLEKALVRPLALQRMGENGRELFLTRFSFEIMFQKYLELYSDLVPAASLAPPEETAESRSSQSLIHA